MLRFRSIDLRAVLEEAQANRCRVILVKDDGVYLMSEIGEKNSTGTHKRLAYAVGCNPNVDEFDQWWDTAWRELGGDDFGEYFELSHPVFARLLNSSDDLIIRADPTHLYLETVAPLSD